MFVCSFIFKTSFLFFFLILSSLLIYVVHIYLSTLSRIDPFRFQARSRRCRPNPFSFYRATLCGMLMLSSCVCLSVTSRHSTKMAKSRIMKQRHTIALGLSFLIPKILTKFRRDHGNRGRVGSNRLISTNISLCFKNGAR